MGRPSPMTARPPRVDLLLPQRVIGRLGDLRAHRVRAVAEACSRSHRQASPACPRSGCAGAMPCCEELPPAHRHVRGLPPGAGTGSPARTRGGSGCVFSPRGLSRCLATEYASTPGSRAVSGRSVADDLAVVEHDDPLGRLHHRLHDISTQNPTPRSSRMRPRSRWRPALGGRETRQDLVQQHTRGPRQRHKLQQLPAPRGVPCREPATSPSPTSASAGRACVPLAEERATDRARHVHERPRRLECPHPSRLIRWAGSPVVCAPRRMGPGPGRPPSV